MNYKLLFPTYRNRYLFIRECLDQLAKEGKIKTALNLGAGEGDYDAMIAAYCEQLVACDINEKDVAFAKALNKAVPNLEYRVEDALNLSFADESFDLVISIEVIEHVGQPERMLAEVSRILKPGGIAVVTFPSSDFPLTYDPVNRILSTFTEKKISQGAYAFGHWYLVSREDFRKWSEKHGLEVVREKNLSGYLVGFLEMYWTGLVQRIFKENASNQTGREKKKVSLRPSTDEPVLTKLTDGIIRIDHHLFKNARHSVGVGMVVRKRPTADGERPTADG